MTEVYFAKIHIYFNYLGTSVAVFWIVTVDIYWFIMVMNDKTVVANYTCLHM